MNVLYGLLPPDEGTIIIDGVEHVSRNPKEAIAAGIGMVDQHFMLVEVFTVAENLTLGREQGTAGWLSMAQARRTVRELSERYRLDVDPDAWSRTCRSGCNSGSRSSRRWPTTPST